MRDQRDEGYFADGALVGKVKQERSSLVDDDEELGSFSYRNQYGRSVPNEQSNPVLADPFKIL